MFHQVLDWVYFELISALWQEAKVMDLSSPCEDVALTVGFCQSLSFSLSPDVFCVRVLLRASSYHNRVAPAKQ